MRTSALFALVALAAAAGCNRMHLYKTAGVATRRALLAQTALTGAPPPRGLDGDEASSIIAAEKRGLTSLEGGTAPAMSAAKAQTLMLQSR